MKPFHTISSRDYRYSIFFRKFHFWSCFAWSSFHHLAHGSLTQTSRARERKITPRREWMTSQGSSADDANVIRFHVGSAHPVHTPFTLSFRPQPSRAHRSAYPFSLTIFHFPFFSLFFPSQESSPTITLVSSKVSIVWRDDVHVSLLLHAFPSITHMRTFPLALCAISFWYHILTHSHSQQKKTHILGLNCMIHSKLARKALLNCSSSDIPAERKGYARDFFCRNLVNINAMSCAHIVVH